MPDYIYQGTRTLEWEAEQRKPKPKKRRKEPCGTPAAYKRHYANSEKPCEKCKAGFNRRRKKHRKRPPRPALQPCGTPAAYRRHVKRKEAACDPCLGAWGNYTRKIKQQIRRNNARSNSPVSGTDG